MADEKEYPAPPKMATDLTLRGLFAKDAPPVPEWFPGNKLPYKGNENIFFIWRLYYADKMIDLLTSHQ